MLAIHQNAKNRLSRARIVDHLFGKENILQSIVGDDVSGRLIVLDELEQENQSMDWPEMKCSTI